MKTGLLTAWLAQVAIITYRGVKTTPRTTPLPMPLPSSYVSSFIIYGGLSLLPGSLAPLPALVGWGFVVATFLNLYTPGSANVAAASNVGLAQGLSSTPPTVKK